jgi:hypothetical protein
MPTWPTILGFLFGLAVVVSGFVVELPRLAGWALLVLIFGGWLVFAIRDRRRARSR